MFYVAILEARPSGRLQYANRFPLVEACKPEKTLQWLSDNLKTTLALSGHLIFYKVSITRITLVVITKLLLLAETIHCNYCRRTGCEAQV